MNSSRTYTKRTSRVPFCKHCDNLKLDNKHWLYINGILACSVLKNTLCINCNKKGHTRSKCTEQNYNYNNNKEKEKEKKIYLTSENIKDKYSNIVNEWPELSIKTSYKDKNKTKETYANILSVETSLSVSSELSIAPTLSVAPKLSIAPTLSVEKPFGIIEEFPLLDIGNRINKMFLYKKWSDYSDTDNESINENKFKNKNNNEDDNEAVNEGYDECYDEYDEYY